MSHCSVISEGISACSVISEDISTFLENWLRETLFRLQTREAKLQQGFKLGEGRLNCYPRSRTCKKQKLDDEMNGPADDFFKVKITDAIKQVGALGFEGEFAWETMLVEGAYVFHTKADGDNVSCFVVDKAEALGRAELMKQLKAQLNHCIQFGAYSGQFTVRFNVGAQGSSSLWPLLSSTPASQTVEVEKRVIVCTRRGTRLSHFIKTNSVDVTKFWRAFYYQVFSSLSCLHSNRFSE